MLYLYAVLEAPPPARSLPPGIGGGAPHFIEAFELVCAASETPNRSVAPEPAEVWRHQQVVEALIDRAPALPLRFGTLVEDASACRRLLTRHRDALGAQLGRVRHCVEFALRVSGLPEEVAPDPGIGGGPGTSYLRTLARREAGWPPSTAVFPHDGLAAHAAERLLWARSTSQPDLRASFLVRKPNVAAFLADVSALQRVRPDLGITCTGPWPPYSFSDPDLSGVSP
ncbi:GvpL/GvpF family gas vesicle protein [Aquabacter spiritensis]|uniref:Gas vesicle protein GvpL/GvpF n=1 Tax=Aquabacter spiritensis TaxID=933073 RepID=A0A4R3LPG7_9HYPH|nr:GvpL/GvpF family gas vesicle protein [Aquabacter spiritensis]TCT02272.1 gas vesicle protein GvpL/GvpF [Aquabacter spiritensis]